VRIAVGFAVPAAAANGLNHGRFSQLSPIIDNHFAGNEYR
jgi:hypothetical protein